VTQLRSVPEGNYVVTLELGGKVKRLNLEVHGNRGKCVDASDPTLKDVKGEFQPHDEGVFVALLRGENLTASQIWIFRAMVLQRFGRFPIGVNTRARCR
jgi:hypothetical protein